MKLLPLSTRYKCGVAFAKALMASKTGVSADITAVGLIGSMHSESCLPASRSSKLIKPSGFPLSSTRAICSIGSTACSWQSSTHCSFTSDTDWLRSKWAMNGEKISPTLIRLASSRKPKRGSMSRIYLRPIALGQLATVNRPVIDRGLFPSTKTRGQEGADRGSPLRGQPIIYI